MANSKQKFAALNEAIKITREFARGGADKSSPAVVLEKTYKTIVKITDEIEASPKE